MDFIIKDVPDVDSVKREILSNAMTTITNYLKNQVPPSAEQLAIAAQIEAIKAKNVMEVKAEEPTELK